MHGNVYRGLYVVIKPCDDDDDDDDDENGDNNDNDEKI